MISQILHENSATKKTNTNALKNVKRYRNNPNEMIVRVNKSTLSYYCDTNDICTGNILKSLFLILLYACYQLQI